MQEVLASQEILESILNSIDFKHLINLFQVIFNSNYEIDRYNVSQNTNGAYILNSKALTLDRVFSSTSGFNIGLKILIQDNNKISGDNFKGDFLIDISKVISLLI